RPPVIPRSPSSSDEQSLRIAFAVSLRITGRRSRCSREPAQASSTSICVTAMDSPHAYLASRNVPLGRRPREFIMVQDSKNLIVGLDIGTSKIVAIVAEVTPEKRLNIIGLGTHPSRGLRQGVAVNIQATMASTQRVLEEAEPEADCAITEGYTARGGGRTR